MNMGFWLEKVEAARGRPIGTHPGTVSEPFSAGERAKIAVKVIDDRGNELMVVRSLAEAIPER